MYRENSKDSNYVIVKMMKKFIHELFTRSVGTNNSSFREDWISDNIKQLKEGSYILDAGAGEARLRNQCKHLNYVAQDIAEYDGKGDGEGIQTKSRDYSKLDIISNIYDIPLEKNSFDAILCIEVLEHVTDPVIALKELYRILKPGGVILITAPFNSLTHYSPYHFSTGFTKYFYLHHLNDIGFNNIEITPNGNYFEYTAQELRRIKSVAKEYSNKKINIINRVVILLLLNLLNKLSRNDTSSYNLQCFGLNVKATKN